MYDEYIRYRNSRDRALKKIQAIIKYTLEQEKENFVPGKTWIPLMRPAISWQEINEAMDSFMKSEFTMGRKVKQFEDSYAKYIGVDHAVMVNSGSSANLLALSVLTNPRKKNKIDKNSEVICPAVGWSTTFFPIINCGLTPVFVDIELGTYNIDVNKIDDAISHRTRAIMAVHLAGNPCNMNTLCKITNANGFYLIEDACEAHGSEFGGKKSGSFGHIGTFSFFMSHHLTTGEGGMLVTSDYEISEIARNLRAFGWIRDMKTKGKIVRQYKKLDERFIFYNNGFNLRPTEIAGSFGIQQLKKIRTNIEKRIKNAKYWIKKLEQFQDVLILPKVNKNTKHVWFGFPITIRDDAPFSKNKMSAYLENNKIETRPLMSGNMIEHPAMRLYKYRTQDTLPNARLVSRNGLFFGNYPQMTEEMREYISNVITEFILKNTKR